MKKNILIIVGILILIIAAGIYVFSMNKEGPAQEQTTTSTEPVLNEVESPKQEPPKEVSITKPLALLTEFITSEAWPPKVKASTIPFACIEGGKEIDANGKTEEKTINNQIYCVNLRTEGAAGSTYKTYTYTTAQEDHTVNTTFTLKYVQCGNYDVEKKTLCDKEQKEFDIDDVVDQMIYSVTL